MNYDYNTRTTKTLINAGASLINQVISLIIKFSSRYVFIYTLGEEYLGVSALFSSMITMLSLADLGFSIALPQALYEPIAKHDENSICRIMKFYSKAYMFIAFGVIGIGVALLPFLQVIIGNKDISGIEHINTIYMLFIIQSAISYLFIYKRTLFTADQKNYYVTVIETIVSIILTGIQIAVLIFLKNYILYLCSSIIAILIQNIFISFQCDRQYPYLTNTKFASRLDKAETKVLSKNIYSLFIYKAAIAVESGTDNLIMTAYCGLIITGVCSNYTLITASITSILMMVMSSATASIGNIIATESRENTYKIYSLLDFMGFWVYAVCGICLVVLINPFISIWLGSGYMIGFWTSAVLCINFYISGVQNVNSNFRNAYGLFYEGRYRPICMVLINIGASVILVKWIGITGIFIGTLLSRILTVGTFDPYIVFKYGLHQKLRKYYASHIFYHTITLVIGFVMYFIFMKWKTTNMMVWIIKAISLFLLTNAVFVLAFWKNKNFIEIKSRITNIMEHRFKYE